MRLDLLTYEKRRRARTLAEKALILDGLEDMETAEGEESEVGDGPRAKRTRRVHPRSVSPDGLMLRKPELEQRDSREYRKFRRHFRRHFRIPYDILVLAQLVKHRKWLSLAAKDVAGRQCLAVVLKDSQSCC